jgi:hypothetical protein
LARVSGPNDSAGSDIGTQEAEHVVEAVILLVDDHHMLDRYRGLIAGT